MGTPPDSTSCPSAAGKGGESCSGARWIAKEMGCAANVLITAHSGRHGCSLPPPPPPHCTPPNAPPLPPVTATSSSMRTPMPLRAPKAGSSGMYSPGSMVSATPAGSSSSRSQGGAAGTATKRLVSARSRSRATLDTRAATAAADLAPAVGRGSRWRCRACRGRSSARLHSTEQQQELQISRVAL